MSSGELRLTRQAWQEMVLHAEACLPEEACGLLGGLGSRVSQVVPVENAEHSASRYRMDPQAQVDTLLGFEREGVELLGIFHSHPGGPAGLSATDVREARYPECVYLVLSPGEGAWVGKAFRVDGEAVQPVPVAITDSTSDPGSRGFSH